VTARRLNIAVSPSLKRGSVLTLLLVASALLSLPESALAQEQAGSVDRVRKGLLKPPALEVEVSSLVPVATFRTEVHQPRFMLTFEERLRKEFKLTDLQRQSWEWGAKCCGLNLDAALTSVRRALQEIREQRIREQIAREVEALHPRAERR
jgi:hypothetical protein